MSLLLGLKRPLRRKKLALLLHDPKSDVFTLQARYGYGDKGSSHVCFAQNSPLIRHFSTHPRPADSARLETMPWLGALSVQEKEGLAELEADAFVPLSTSSGLIGLLVLGRQQWLHNLLPVQELESVGLSRIAAMLEAAQLYQHLDQSLVKASTVPERAHEIGLLECVDRAARGVAHDLNNTFTTILIHAEAAEQAGEVGEVQSHMSAIRQAVTDGGELLRAIQDIARQPSRQASNVDINDVVRRTLLMIAPAWRQGRILSSTRAALQGAVTPLAPNSDLAMPRSAFSARITVDLTAAGQVSGNSSELRRVMTNLVSNAIEALPEEDGHIEIKSGLDGYRAFIIVQDNGMGIPQKLKAGIFEPLFTTKAQPGRGLGLSISREIVGRHGGTLKVESEEGRGSTFTLLLPIAEQAPRSSP